MDMYRFQLIVKEWHNRIFGEQYGTGYRNLLGLSEEVGELCHAHLKGEQQITYSPAKVRELKMDAVGDILIFLCNYCDSQGLHIDDCADFAYKNIEGRVYINK
mgnify:FL=1